MSDIMYLGSFSEKFCCSHTYMIQFQEGIICQQCGLFQADVYLNYFLIKTIHQPKILSYKTLKMKFNAFFDPFKIIKFVQQSNQKGMLNQGSLNEDYLQQRPQIIEFIIDLSDRLSLSKNTAALAIPFIDQHNHKFTVPEHLVFLYASTSLALAAKSVELDERIPFISKLKKFCSLTQHPEVKMFTHRDFKLAEQNVIKGLDWDLQQITLLDRVEYILSLGVVDDIDTIEEQGSFRNFKDYVEKEKVEMIAKIEGNYSQISLSVIKDRLNFKYEDTLLAGAIIGYLRKSRGMNKIWSSSLQAILGAPSSEITTIIKNIEDLMSKQEQPQPLRLNNQLQTSSTRVSQKASFRQSAKPQINNNTNYFSTNNENLKLQDGKMEGCKLEQQGNYIVPRFSYMQNDGQKFSNFKEDLRVSKQQ